MVKNDVDGSALFVGEGNEKLQALEYSAKGFASYGGQPLWKLPGFQTIYGDSEHEVDFYVNLNGERKYIRDHESLVAKTTSFPSMDDDITLTAHVFTDFSFW